MEKYIPSETEAEHLRVEQIRSRPYAADETPYGKGEERC